MVVVTVWETIFSVEHYCIVYLVFVGEFKKNVTRQTWRALFHLGE
jgi:hypothetical protein